MLKNVTELFEKKLVKLDDQRQKTITSKLVSTLERYFTSMMVVMQHVPHRST